MVYGHPVQGQPMYGHAQPMAMGGQQRPPVPGQNGPGNWSSGLCQCDAPGGKCDCSMCCAATLCPWTLHGATAKMMRTGYRTDACNGWDTRECATAGCLCVGGTVLGCILNGLLMSNGLGCSWIGGVSMISYTQGLRKQVRQRHGVDDRVLADFCLHCWCHPCAAAQEHYEVKTRLPPPETGMPTMFVQPMQQGMHAPQYGQQPQYAPQQTPYYPGV